MEDNDDAIDEILDEATEAFCVDTGYIRRNYWFNCSDELKQIICELLTIKDRKDLNQ